MGIFLTVIIIAFIVFIVCGGFVVVPQQTADIIERFGKYHKVLFAGIHAKIPWIDHVANKTDLRITQLQVDLTTKTLDNVFVRIVASAQFEVNPHDVAKAYYTLSNPGQQLEAYMQDALRSAVPHLTLDDTFAKKDDIAASVKKTVGQEMAQFGFQIVSTLITTIEPSEDVRKSMDSINAAQRMKEATRQKAEAQKIQIETQAAAEAEKTRLEGEGQANYRREIANGLVDQITSLKKAGMDTNSVNDVVLFNQYLDVIRGLADSPTAKTLVLPAATPGGYSDLYHQMVNALETAKHQA